MVVPEDNKRGRSMSACRPLPTDSLPGGHDDRPLETSGARSHDIWRLERVKRFDLNFSCNFFEQYQCLRTPGNFRCWTFCWTFHWTLLCRSTWLVCHSRPVSGSMEIREVLVATPVSATLRFHPTRWHLRRAGTGRASKASRCLRHHLNLASVCTHFSCDEDVID